jgi:Tol biopolymer transport system component
VQVDFQPFSWSPSGKHLLLYRDKGLYISDADGSNLRLVYTTRNPISRGTSWLNDDTILLEILVDQSEPHVYYLDVNSGNVHKPDLDYWRFIEAVSPNGDFWIQSSSKGLEIASVDGKRSVILGEYEHVNRTTQPYLNPNIVLLPDERGLVFAGCINKDCYIYLTDLAERQVLSVRPIFELGNTIPVSNFRVSPNGTYLSFVDNQNELHILNLATNKVEYQWLWNIPMGPLYYVWSPDSSAIAAPFFDDKTKRYVGLAVLDIVTGTWQQITQSSTVEYILGWRLISTEK